MQKILFVAVFLILFVWGCSPKTTPTKTETSSATPPASLPVPVADSINLINNSTVINMGKQIYTAKCGRCHSLKNPTNYTKSEWMPILDGMAPKAHLTDMEKANVLAYVNNNAKPA